MVDDKAKAKVKVKVKTIRDSDESWSTADDNDSSEDEYSVKTKKDKGLEIRDRIQSKMKGWKQKKYRKKKKEKKKKSKKSKKSKGKKDDSSSEDESGSDGDDSDGSGEESEYEEKVMVKKEDRPSRSRSKSKDTGKSKDKSIRVRSRSKLKEKKKSIKVESRSRSRSKFKDRKSKKKTKSRSRSRSTSKSRNSKRKSRKSRSRSRSCKRSRLRSKDRRKKSRSPVRRRRSRTRSPVRRRAKSPVRRRRSRSRSRSKRRRSRSRSRDCRRRSRSRSRSRSKRRDSPDKKTSEADLNKYDLSYVTKSDLKSEDKDSKSTLTRRTRMPAQPTAVKDESIGTSKVGDPIKIQGEFTNLSNLLEAGGKKKAGIENPYGNWEPVTKKKPEIEKFASLCAGIYAKENEPEPEPGTKERSPSPVYHPFQVKEKALAAAIVPKSNLYNMAMVPMTNITTYNLSVHAPVNIQSTINNNFNEIMKMCKPLVWDDGGDVERSVSIDKPPGAGHGKMTSESRQKILDALKRITTGRKCPFISEWNGEALVWGAQEKETVNGADVNALLSAYKESLPKREYIINTGTHAAPDGSIISDWSDEEIKDLKPDYFKETAGFIEKDIWQDEVWRNEHARYHIVSSERGPVFESLHNLDIILAWCFSIKTFHRHQKEKGDLLLEVPTKHKSEKAQDTEIFFVTPYDESKVIILMESESEDNERRRINFYLNNRSNMPICQIQDSKFRDIKIRQNDESGHFVAIPKKLNVGEFKLVFSVDGKTIEEFTVTIKGIFSYF